jgi:hypothetical protein
MPFNPNTDYSEQLNEMLAPYQRMTQQSQNPYATMSQNSWLAKNHPRMAGILDNAFLTAGMTPEARGPEGVGGGISRTFQGLMGAQRFRHEQSLEASMLPLQMLEPRLKAENQLSEIDLHKQQAQLASLMPGIREGQLNIQQQGIDVRQQMADVAQQRADFQREKGGLYGYKPTEAERYAGGQSYRDYSANETLAGRAPESEEVYNKRLFGFAGLRAGAAGAGGEAGRQGAPHEYDEAKMMLDNEYKSAHSRIPSLQNEDDYRKSLNPEKLGEYYSDPNSYQKYVDKHQMLKDQADFNFAQYQKSGAWKNKIGYQEWLKNPNQTGPKVATSPSTNSGTAWTPK